MPSPSCSCAIGVLALRRGSFGRKLVAANDSPAACATLGVNVNGTKLITFTIAAGTRRASPARCSAACRARSSANDFAALGSLVVLLLARVGGINTATGALLGASTLTVFSVAQPHLPGMGRTAAVHADRPRGDQRRPHPNGFGGRIAKLIERFRPQPDELPEELKTLSDEGTVGSVFFAEEQELAHAGH